MFRSDLGSTKENVRDSMIDTKFLTPFSICILQLVGFMLYRMCYATYVYVSQNPTAKNGSIEFFRFCKHYIVIL